MAAFVVFASKTVVLTTFSDFWAGLGSGGLLVGVGSGGGTKLFLQVTDAADEFGQLLDGEDLAFELAVGYGGCAEHFRAVLDVMHDAGLRGDGHLVANF